ncbi:Aste57867_22374 [Aphanomyces stellatus]|uniref:Aste57867_22374 protein n=1 Tax=Aphanomyces stellatus TaxID=120398 RepID=A0A485LLT5_9STRA|nr:hypothetical protein As57867_022304 [Aphanomyces stellatus]VFT99037.1 Aste57867_22374 [Aphanomyces stellatus]
MGNTVAGESRNCISAVAVHPLIESSAVATTQATPASSSTAAVEDEIITVEPTQGLEFLLLPHTTPVAVLTLRNLSSTMAVVYGILAKEDIAHRFYCQPPRGYIGPGKIATVAVVLKPGFCRAFLATPAADRSATDRHSLRVHVAAVGTAMAVPTDAADADTKTAAFWTAQAPKSANVWIVQVPCRLALLRYNTALNA